MSSLPGGARWNACGAVVRNLVLIAGGYVDIPATMQTNVVDIFDLSTLQWRTPQYILSAPRSNIVSATTGTRVIFAGGVQWNGNTHISVTNLDIFDASRFWSQGSLPEARSAISAISLATKVLFSGGWTSSVNSDRVDIYEVTTGVWTHTRLSTARDYIAAATVGNWVVLSGGALDPVLSSSAVDLFMFCPPGQFNSSRYVCSVRVHTMSCH